MIGTDSDAVAQVFSGFGLVDRIKAIATLIERE
jgi:hypothetical protein